VAVARFTMDLSLAVKMEYLAVLAVVVREAGLLGRAILLQLTHRKEIMAAGQ
jgi:hypothetical protein